MDSLVQFLYTCSQRSIHTECIPVTFKDKEKMSAVDERGSAEKMEDNSIDPSASSSPCSFSFRFGKPWKQSPFSIYPFCYVLLPYRQLPRSFPLRFASATAATPDRSTVLAIMTHDRPDVSAHSASFS